VLYILQITDPERSLHQVLYNADCISDQAIFYWASKGAKPQGKQHFIKATEPLVKVCIDIHLLHISFKLHRIDRESDPTVLAIARGRVG
jgi:hypothetical protein